MDAEPDKPILVVKSCTQSNNSCMFRECSAEVARYVMNAGSGTAVPIS